jgi:hypothetical protein
LSALLGLERTRRQKRALTTPAYVSAAPAIPDNDFEFPLHHQRGRGVQQEFRPGGASPDQRHRPGDRPAVAFFYIQALDTCECCFLAYDAFTALCDQYREWERLGRHLLEQLVIKKERREADVLLLSPQERYLQFLREYGEMADRIPNYHIASYLGITF